MTKHDYYVVRRGSYKVSVCCKHCNREWSIKPKWSFLFLALRVILIWGYVALFLLYPFDRVYAGIIGLVVVCAARSLPAYLVCLYMKKTGNYEKFIEQL